MSEHLEEGQFMPMASTANSSCAQPSKPANLDRRAEGKEVKGIDRMRLGSKGIIGELEAKQGWAWDVLNPKDAAGE